MLQKRVWKVLNIWFLSLAFDTQPAARRMRCEQVEIFKGKRSTSECSSALWRPQMSLGSTACLLLWSCFTKKTFTKHFASFLTYDEVLVLASDASGCFVNIPYETRLWNKPQTSDAIVSDCLSPGTEALWHRYRSRWMLCSTETTGTHLKLDCLCYPWQVGTLHRKVWLLKLQIWDSPVAG